MNDKPLTLLDRFKAWILVTLGTLALRYCGHALLYWLNPYGWEDFLATGEGVKNQ